jgi:hypothetical protein
MISDPNASSAHNPNTAPEPTARSSFHLSLSPSQQAPADALAQMMTYPLRGTLWTMAKDVVVCLDELVFLQHAPIGRRTCVIRTMVVRNYYEGWKGRSTAVGFSFTPKRRTLEGGMPSGILVIARSRRMLTAKACDTWEERNATEDHEKFKRDVCVVNRLPDILYCDALKLTDVGAQFRLSEKLKLNQVPQILLMTELFPITGLKTSDEVVPAIRDIFKCKFSDNSLFNCPIN